MGGKQEGGGGKTACSELVFYFDGNRGYSNLEVTEGPAAGCIGRVLTLGIASTVD